MIQDTDQDIDIRFEKTNPYQLQLKITTFFKEFFEDVFNFDNVEHKKYVVSDDGMDATYSKDAFILHFKPQFLLKGSKHLKRGDNARGIDAAKYVMYRTQTVMDMRSVVDLLNYRLSEFVKQFNQAKLNTAILSDAAGLAHNASLNHDASKVLSHFDMNMVYGLEMLNREDVTIDNMITFQITIDERYMFSNVHVIQWHQDYLSTELRETHHCIHPFLFTNAAS